MSNKKILIVGVGNLLCRDDGIGVHVINEMKNLNLPNNVELLDIGTSTLDLFSYLKSIEKMIVIDAIKGGLEPGSIYRLFPEDLIPDSQKPIALHEIGLLESLRMAEKMGIKVKTVIIGIEPEIIDWGMELTERLRAKIPLIIETVLKELDNF